MGNIDVSNVRIEIDKAVWIKLGMQEINKNLQPLKCCFVGRWGNFVEKVLGVVSLESWVVFN